MSASNVLTCRRITIAAFAALFAACTGKSSARSDSSSASGGIISSDSTASATTMVRGTITSVSATTLAVQTDAGTTEVQVAEPLRVYERQPARLEDITPNTFIGVTTVKQPDGSDRATEIHIFPEELRGLGEGSRPMAPAASSGGAASRMTNGAANTPGTQSTMTNGSALGPQMSNGSATNRGSTLVVQYAGGTTKATVPAATPVTKLAATSKPLAVGDRVVVLTTKSVDGTLATNRVLLSK